MSADLALLDTNILVYAFDPRFEYHAPCREVLHSGNDPKASLCVVPQVLAEFFAVVTKPDRVHTPREPHEALDAIELILAMPGVTLLPTPVELVVGWVHLVRQRPVRGRNVFDVQLAATMVANGVKRIYTINRVDFEGFEEIEVLTP